MDEDHVDEAGGWDLDAAVAQILEATGLPDDVTSIITECLDGVEASYPDGWLVLWWVPVELDLEGIAFTGNTLPAAEGWNCIYVADRDGLLAVVVDAADQGSSCTVIDINECF